MLSLNPKGQGAGHHDQKGITPTRHRMLEALALGGSVGAGAAFDRGLSQPRSVNKIRNLEAAMGAASLSITVTRPMKN